MRNLNIHNGCRRTDAAVIKMWGWSGDHMCGMFEMPSKVDGGILRIVASVGEGWDHVSVSRTNRCPNWLEMDYVKRQFFKDDEVAMQLHVTPKDHISYHDYCLHLWRPLNAVIPLPPAILVGPTQQGA